MERDVIENDDKYRIEYMHTSDINERAPTHHE